MVCSSLFAAGDFDIYGGKLMRYSGNDTKVVIPGDVYKIDKGAFERNSSIREVVLPQGVEIDEYAFRDCVNLEKKQYLTTEM